MALKAFMAIAGILALIQTGWTASYSVKADTGVVLLWQSKAGYWAAVKDSAAVGLTDSLFVDDKYAATLKSTQGLSLMLRGESRICLTGNDSAVTVHFDQGQLFLKKDETAQPKSITIAAQGCLFTPVGTAAAIKLTKAGEPTVAVVRGKVLVESPKGQTVVVEAGTFGTYSPTTAAFKQGKIPPEALAGLEKWSGVSLEQPVVTSQTAASDSSKSHKDGAQTASAPEVGAVTSAPLAQTSPATPSATHEAQSVNNAASVQPAAVSQGSPAVESEKAKNEPAEGKKEAPEKERSGAGATAVTWEVSAFSVTVNREQWTRLAISPDIPIWKFGLGLDIECFLDEKGNFSQKAWEFGDSTWYTSLIRKIKYIRFGHENDPFFAKVGGLSSVTLGYGFIVDRFSNMLHYPDQKLLGVQVYLNNIGPLGVTLQTMTPDVMEFKDNGGIAAARLALCPLKPMNLPLLSGLSVGATYATDLNQFAPARSWSYPGKIWDKNGNGKVDWDWAYQHEDSASVKRNQTSGIVDSASTHYAKLDTGYRDTVQQYALLGGDIGIPLIKNVMLSLDIYGQVGVVADSNMFKSKRTGWGFGAPGVRLSLGPLVAQAEYRHVSGRFIPGYFDPYYMDERLQRYPQPMSRSQWLDSLKRGAADLDGVFGELSMNFFNVIDVGGSYQYMAGSNDALDQRFEARGSIGEAILKRLPKITKLETYFFKTAINRTVVVYYPSGAVYRPKGGQPVYDDFFEQTPTLFWGYRVGFEIAKGASLIWDTRYGYEWDQNYRLVSNNNMCIGTVITF